MKKQKKSSRKQQKLEQRIEEIRHEIAKLELVSPGTLSERYNTCGKPNCRCAQDPSARHGPYYDLTRREGGRLVHRLVTASQADELAKAIENNRKVLELLAEWGRKSLQLILESDGRKR